MIRTRIALCRLWGPLTWPGAALLVVAVLAMVRPNRVFAGDSSALPVAPAGNVTTLPLEYQETSFQFLFRNVPVERRLVHFSKEPALAPGPAVRGVLKFGGNPSNAIPFVWEGGAKKLHLDLNRNQDLTDDPAGVIPDVHERATVFSRFVSRSADAGGP